MNYRHAFHAGNFADVMKHAVLARIFEHLRRKPKPFRFIDTHAGIGLYDLDGPDARRTGEWRGGVGRLAEPLPAEAEAVIRPYRDAVAAVRARHGPSAYPGSPEIARRMLRPDDRAVLVEMHPEDAADLRRRVRTARNVKVLAMDGWLGLGSLIPPPERRGLVLVDPPYEEAGELSLAFGRLDRAVRKWPTGTFVLWYPIKSTAAVDEAVAPLLDPPVAPALRLELFTDRPDAGARLVGSGLLIFNSPWTLAADARALLPALAERCGGPAASVRVDERTPPEG